MDSLWLQTCQLPEYPALSGDVHTDVLVIGGGITGLLCAYKLRREGINCVVAEAGQICGGVTGRTTAKVTAQHGLVYRRLASQFGLEAAAQYLYANLAAVDEYRKFSLGQGTNECLQSCSAFSYSQDNPGALEAELEVLGRMSYGARFVQSPNLPFPTVGAVEFPNQAQIHPLQFLRPLLGELQIYEHTLVRDWDGKTARCSNGTISAQWAIAATHFPIWNRSGLYFLKLFQERHAVLALGCPDGLNDSNRLDDLNGLDGMYVDGTGNGPSLRMADDLLLLGGAGQRTGKFTGWSDLEALAARFYPDHPISYRWATQDCMTLDALPYIGSYGANMPNLLVATGFNGWGMTSAMVAARLLTDRVLEKANDLYALFDPSRRIWRKQLALNALESAAGLLTFRRPRCPHLGCALRWNRSEHSWDCSCHGSRFGDNGALLDNPAQAPLSPSAKRSPPQ